MKKLIFATVMILGSVSFASHKNVEGSAAESLLSALQNGSGAAIQCGADLCQTSAKDIVCIEKGIATSAEPAFECSVTAQSDTQEIATKVEGASAKRLWGALLEANADGDCLTGICKAEAKKVVCIEEGVGHGEVEKTITCSFE